ncbi:MAG TPA: hypothetical protein PL033_17805 [Candidatus Brocadiia bacterium]|nr:hypothetical protein [Candidatus Brocadiia bacterium]
MDGMKASNDPNSPPEPIQETPGWKEALAVAAVMALAGAGMIALMGAGVQEKLPHKATQHQTMGIYASDAE